MAGSIAETMPAALAGQRLDRVVAMLAEISRGDAAELVTSGAVRVGDRAVLTRSHRLVEGDVVVIDLPEAAVEGLVADPSVDVPVVYEDHHLLVVDKPAGLVVHPGAGRTEATLVHGVLARYPEIGEVGEPDRPGIVHRLDVGTSGLMLVARTAEAYDGLVTALAGRAVDRRYRVVVWGTVEAPAGVVDAAIGRSGRDRTRMAVTRSGRPALTRYDVVRRFTRPLEVTEVTCTLSTGRTHQIRVHMASIGHPVLGDSRYGRGRRPLRPLARPWLHAEHLAFAHPVTAEHLAFDSSPPEELVTFLNGFE